ncbi:Predicted NTPase (NACHT family) [Mycobacterium tuberculosis]|nr:Predicted NTPase (NACHT family) [Mycobacterium tuberculosis]
MTGGAAIERLLRSAVVPIEVPGTGQPVLGTGFLVAPHVVATCAHVVARTRAELPEAVFAAVPGNAEKIELVPVPEWYVRNGLDGPDLAFLWSAKALDHAHAMLAPAVETGDALLTYGHPAGQFRGGQSATLHYAGASRLEGDRAGWEPERVVGTPVSGGYSGSPVLNLRTGAVCGMMCMSNDRGSAHMVGAADILRHLPEEAAAAQRQGSGRGGAAWLAALTDDQIAAGGWRYAGPRLRDYLETAVRAALLPSPSDADGTSRLPDLADVYMEQSAMPDEAVPDGTMPDGTVPDETVPDGAGPGRRAAIPAAEIFQRDAHAIIFGGPGLGKSSLLRMGLTGLARAWLDDDPPAGVPVRVQATDLADARPLPQLIAASVEADLSAAGIVSSWPPEFFAAEPVPGTRWIVFIDGLDDIVDLAARRSVLDKLAGVANGPHASLYRFVLASRPLSLQELEQDDAWIGGRYELQPFTLGQLRRFAEHMLTELGTDDPAAVAERLVDEVDRANLSGIAVVPLMATMLCQLLALDFDRPLPTGLTGIYEDFTQALAAPQYVDGKRGIFQQAEAAFRPYGPRAVRAVTDVLDRSADLLGRLALARHDGSTEPALELLVGWERESRPQPIPEKRWREFLKGILRRSGLLTERLGDFVFVHDTICDYLAARAIVADEDRSFAAFHQLFYEWQRPWPGVAEVWRQPSWRYSLTRFLIALWPGRDRMFNALRGVAEKGGLAGCAFVVSLLQDGVVTDERLAAAAAPALERIASTPVDRGFAARQALDLLAWMGAKDQLRRVATADSASRDTRRRATVVLAELGDGWGGARLAELAGDDGHDADERLDAFGVLVRLGDERAADLLEGIVEALGARMGVRRTTERIVVQLGKEQGADVLARIAESEAPARPVREAAARALIRHGDRRGPSLLGAVLGDDDSGADAPAPLQEDLDLPRYPLAPDMLRLIAANTALNVQIRLRAFEALTRPGAQSFPGLLAALTKDPSTGPDTRKQVLALFAGMRTKGLSVPGTSGAAVPDAGSEDRPAVLTGEDHVNVLGSIALDGNVEPHMRIAAAESLDLFGVPDTAQYFQAIVDDTSVPEVLRRRVAEMVASGERGRVPKLNASFDVVPPVGKGPSPASKGRQAAWQELFVTLSRWPARWLAEEGGGSDGLVLLPQCLDAIADSGRDTSLSKSLRLAAAKALISLGDARGTPIVTELHWNRSRSTPRSDATGAELCLKLLDEAAEVERRLRKGGGEHLPVVAERLLLLHSLADDPDSDINVRFNAAEVIARSGDGRGNDILLQLLGDSSQSNKVRGRAAQTLKALGDPRGVNLLRGMAVDRRRPASERQAATRWLNLIGQDTKSYANVIKPERAWLRGARSLPDPGLSARLQLKESATVPDLETRAAIRYVLAQFGDPETVRDLLATATDPGVPSDRRREAIGSLALQGAAGELADLAEDPGQDATVRCWAAEEASWLGDPRGTETLVSIAGDRSVDSYTRRGAAHFLAWLNDPRGTRLLAGLATDPATTIDARRTATELLIQLEFTGDLVALVLAPETADGARLNAVDILASHGDEPEYVLARIRAEPALSSAVRHRAAQALTALPARWPSTAAGG